MSGAFNPTPLRPDTPAFPMHSHEAEGWNTQVPYVEGLTARQHAAIALCVPDSGVDWLDAIIEQRRRDEFASAALAALIAMPHKDDVKRGAKGVPILSGYAYEYADAMLAAAPTAAVSAAQKLKPFAYFVQPSGFGPFIECESSQAGAFPAFRAAVSAAPSGEVDLSKLTRFGWTEAYIGESSELVEDPQGQYVKFANVAAITAAKE